MKLYKPKPFAFLLVVIGTVGLVGIPFVVGVEDEDLEAVWTLVVPVSIIILAVVNLVVIPQVAHEPRVESRYD